MISIKQLIQVAPFPEDQRKKLIENIDKLTDDQKYRLSNIAWKALAHIYFAQLKAERQLLMDEVIHEKRKMNPNDFEEIEAKLLHEFAQKLEAAESQESIGEVRKELEKFKTQPLSQDVAGTPPPQKP